MTEIDRPQAKIQSLNTRITSLQQQVSAAKDKELQYLRLIDSLYSKISGTSHYEPGKNKNDFDGLTFVIIAYNMPLQLERTLVSCSPEYQQADPGEIEIIVVDNGSDVPLSIEDLRRFNNVSKVIRIDGKPSPVFGLNEGIKQAKFSNIAIMIDGAHMLSPGVFRNAKSIIQLMPRPVISIPQYIFGPTSQNLRTSKDAFERESKHLKAIEWPSNGYRLFEYAIFPGENYLRDIYEAIESNCLITTKAILNDCGVLDERFDEPGGGLANLELYIRLCHDTRNEYVTTPGEGTFHQDHSGTTTSPSIAERQALVDKYFEQFRDLTGNENLLRVRAPFYYGVVRSVTRRIPTISREYGAARHQILSQLADIYTKRAQYDQSGEIPLLTLNKSADEHVIRPVLIPLGILDQVARKQNVNPNSLSYLAIIQKIHTLVKPNLYIELGVDNGACISLARCSAIGVDPSFEITKSLPNPTRIFRIKSDQFFDNKQLCASVLSNGIDLCFIDAMHLAEYVLRDFINVEKWANGNCVIILDDVYPEQIAMSRRNREFNAWCGDVYKIIPILLNYRPDLSINVFEAFIGPYRKGIAIISNLDHNNTILQENYEGIVDDILGEKYSISDMEDLEALISSTSIAQLDNILQRDRTSHSLDLF